jgi:hypothetical protein
VSDDPIPVIAVIPTTVLGLHLVRWSVDVNTLHFEGVCLTQSGAERQVAKALNVADP